MSFEGKSGLLTISELLGLAISGQRCDSLVVRVPDNEYHLKCEDGTIIGISSNNDLFSLKDILQSRDYLTENVLEKIPKSTISDKGFEQALVESKVISADKIQLARYHLAELIFFDLLSHENGSFEFLESIDTSLILFDIAFRDWMNLCLPDVNYLKGFRGFYPDFDTRLYWISPTKFDDLLPQFTLPDIKILSRYQPQFTVRSYWYAVSDSQKSVTDSLRKLAEMDIYRVEAPLGKIPNSRPFMRALLGQVIEKLESVNALIGIDGEIVRILQGFTGTLGAEYSMNDENVPSLDDVSLDDLTSITSSIEDLLDMNGLSDLNLDPGEEKPESIPEQHVDVDPPKPETVKPTKQKKKAKAKPKPASTPEPESEEDDSIEMETLEEKVAAKVKLRNFISNVTMAHNRLTLRNISYFEMLNITPNADRKTIHKAFVKSIKSINPKGIRVPKRDEDILEKAVIVRDKLKEAYDKLIDTKTRRIYMSRLRESREERERKKSKAMYLFNDGMAEFRAGNYDAARKIFKQAIEYDPNSPVYYSMLESIHKEERLSDASKFFQAGILAYKQKNDFDRAVKLIRKAISLMPGQTSFHVRLAEIQATRAEARRDAIKNYEIAIDLDPGNLEIKMILAAFLKQCGLKQDAANRYGDILRWNPSNNKARQELLALVKEGIKPQKLKDKKEVPEDLDDDDDDDEI